MAMFGGMFGVCACACVCVSLCVNVSVCVCMLLAENISVFAVGLAVCFCILGSTYFLGTLRIVLEGVGWVLAR